MIEITEFEIELVIRIILSFVLSGVVGLEREVSLKPAGLRTHILVGLGSTLITILSVHAFPGAEPSRVAASVIVGIGFLGAGTILKSEDKVIGLTTAASLWVVSSVGVAIGTGFYVLAAIVAVISFLVLKLDFFERTTG